MITHLGPYCYVKCLTEFGDMMEDDNYPRNKPMRKETSEMEDLDGTGMDKGAVAMDLQRKESHMERTTGERKVDGLEHRLSNELA